MRITQSRVVLDWRRKQSERITTMWYVGYWLIESLRDLPVFSQADAGLRSLQGGDVSRLLRDTSTSPPLHKSDRGFAATAWHGLGSLCSFPCCTWWDRCQSAGASQTLRALSINRRRDRGDAWRI